MRQVTGRERSREQDPARTPAQDSAAAAASSGTPAGLAGTLTAAAGLPKRTITTMFDRLASPEGLTAQASTFTRRQVLCAVGRELPAEAAGTVGPAELEQLADRFLAERAVSVVLVGDDKQLAAIEAGGGFRGLRLRLGAATLTENRRQAEPWERQAVEHLRDGNIDAALSAYREHDRLVAVETPGQLKETMLADWWRSFQQGNRVVILAYRRDEVDQFNTACQQLRDAQGHLGPERLTVRDRSFAVGDQVVCGKNAIKSLEVATGTRGQVVAVDLEQRSMTLRLENGNTVVLPGEYLDQRPARWLGNNPDRRTMDLAYASTGHKSQGGTWDEVLLRVTGAEDRQWLHVGGSRAIGRTRYYSVISPEPASRQDREREVVDVPAADRTPKQQAEQLAADTTALVNGRRMSKHDLRAELHRLNEVMEKAPRDQSRLVALATSRREQSDQRLAEATSLHQDARDLVALLEHGRGSWANDRSPSKVVVWDRAVEQTIEYRQRWKVDDPERALGPEPHGTDASLAQRRAWRHSTRAVGRLCDLAGDRTERSDRHKPTDRSDHRGDRGRPDHRDRDQGRAM